MSLFEARHNTAIHAEVESGSSLAAQDIGYHQRIWRKGVLDDGEKPELLRIVRD